MSCILFIAPSNSTHSLKWINYALKNNKEKSSGLAYQKEVIFQYQVK